MVHRCICRSTGASRATGAASIIARFYQATDAAVKFLLFHANVEISLTGWQ